MGIKDNFSQAVRELWKKDGEQPANNTGNNDKSSRPAQPTELDKYLRQDQEKMNSADEPPVIAETPASPAGNTAGYVQGNAGVQGAQNVQDIQNIQGGQSVPNAQNIPSQSGGYVPPQSNQPDYSNYNNYNNPEMPGINRNVQNIQQNIQGNSGQNNTGSTAQGAYGQANQNAYVQGVNRAVNYGQGGQGGGFVPPAQNAPQVQGPNEIEEITVISKNTEISGNIRSLANMQVEGKIRGNIETTRNVDLSGTIIGDIVCNDAGMNSAAMQGNMSLKGRMRMDRDTILIGDVSSQYADINGRIRGKLDVVGKAELKRDAIVFGDINASTIAVTDGAIIQGYVNTTFLSKEDSRNVFPDAISIDSKE